MIIICFIMKYYLAGSSCTTGNYCLLFLHNKNVPATNNEAERLLRKYKRKQAQAVSFRSPSSIDHLCKCMSMLVLMRRKEQTNLFREIAEIFA